MSDLKTKYHEFRNNVFSRHESNQHKARKIWKEIKIYVPEKERQSFRIEWIHYMDSEFDADGFGVEIKKIEKYLIK